jgi:hypothetical protein
MTDSAEGAVRTAARRRRRAASWEARGRENSSSRWCARNDGEEGVGAEGEAALVVKGLTSKKDTTPRRRRDIRAAGERSCLRRRYWRWDVAGVSDELRTRGTCNRAARIFQVCKTVRYGLVPLTFQKPDGSN